MEDQKKSHWHQEGMNKMLEVGRALSMPWACKKAWIKEDRGLQPAPQGMVASALNCLWRKIMRRSGLFHQPVWFISDRQQTPKWESVTTAAADGWAIALLIFTHNRIRPSKYLWVMTHTIPYAIFRKEWKNSLINGNFAAETLLVWTGWRRRWLRRSCHSWPIWSLLKPAMSKLAPDPLRLYDKTPGSTTHL